MRVIGLTGSIACGKSTVSDFLKSRGFPVVDGDQLSRELTQPGSPVLGEIRRAFGEDYFSASGSLNRRALGRLIFSDPAARQALDDLMAPHLESLTLGRIGEARAAGAALCFLDMPLLFEKGYDRFCDAVWSVWLPPDLQLSRLMDRDGYSREEAESRIRSVLSSDEKAARANRVIDNSGTPDQTFAIVENLLQEEISRASAPSRSRRSRSGAPAVPQTPAVSAPAAAPASSTDPPVLSPDQPDLLERPAPVERPEQAKRRPSRRKAAWRMPVWIRTTLIILTGLVLVGITSLSLMAGYLRRQSDQHEAEQRSIDNNYPLVYRDLIEANAAEYNLSPAFVSAIIRNESSFDREAVSGVGARGLMQLMPDTAEWIAHKLGVEGYSFERMYDPESNIRFGCWYLNYLSKLFLGDPVCVAAAYHAGQGQVKIWLSDPALSEDGYTMPLSSLPEGPTKTYVGRVTRDYGIYQEKYFSSPVSSPDPGDAALRLSGLVGKHP